MLELGETIAEGVRRELLEETGLEVKVIELIEVFERIFPASPPEGSETSTRAGGNSFGPTGRGSPGCGPTVRTEPRGLPPQGPLYHFVILDYLCEAPEGEPHAGGDVTDVAFAAEEELERFLLNSHSNPCRADSL